MFAAQNKILILKKNAHVLGGNLLKAPNVLFVLT